MTSEGWAISETSTWQKGVSAARGNGGAHEHLPAAAGGWPTQWDCRIFSFSGQSARDGCGAARWLGRDGWGSELSLGCAGRNILTIPDTGEINFTTTRARSCGLDTGWVWTRDGRVTVPHRNRPLSEKGSQRWLSTAEAAKTVLRPAHMVTEIDLPFLNENNDTPTKINRQWFAHP